MDIELEGNNVQVSNSGVQAAIRLSGKTSILQFTLNRDNPRSQAGLDYKLHSLFHRSEPILIKICAVALGLALVLYGIRERSLRTTNSHVGPKADYCGAGICSPAIPMDDLQNKSTWQRPEYAVSEAKRDLIRDPASPYRWEDLGESMLKVQDINKAKYCFQQAVASAPKNPAILLRAANFNLLTGNSTRAIQLLERILENPELAEYDLRVFRIYTESGIAIGEILAHGIPNNRCTAEAFLEFLMGEKRLQDTRATWNWANHRSLVSNKLSNEYVAFLIHNKLEPQAAETIQNGVLKTNTSTARQRQ